KPPSAREFPELAVAEPIFIEPNVLLVKAPGMEDITIKLELERLNTMVKIWEQPYVAVDQGDEAADWFSRYLRTPSRLSRIGDAFDRSVSVQDKYVAQVSFADHFPVVIATQEALDYLNQE